jgi:membrane-bound lytic murein transglycosylase D
VIALLRGYLASAALLAIGAGALWLCVRFCPRALGADPRRWVRIAVLWLAAAFALPVAAELGGRLPSASAAVVVWSRDLQRGDAHPATSIALRGSDTAGPMVAVDLPNRWLFAAAAVVGSLVLVLFAGLVLRARTLARVCAALPVVRRQGRVRVCASDEFSAPFSARTPGVAYVVIPTALWADLDQVRMVLAHEAAHLRRGDLGIAFVLAALKRVFFWNPAAHAFERVLRLLQEMACDRAVERRFGSVRYGRCLVAVAALGRRHVFQLTGAVHMARASHQDLERRLRMLFSKPANGTATSSATKSSAPRALAAGVTLVVTAVMAAVTFFATAAVADRRIDAAAVKEMAARIEGQTGFAVPVDDWIVAKVNELVGQRRDWSKKSLERMAPVRQEVEAALSAAGLPKELIAVAFAESGFDATARSSWGSAGVWQFLPKTARGYGLEVSETRDERLDLKKSTASAATFLKELRAEFGEWPLAIAAYNRGPGLLRNAITKLGTRDLATLARAGRLGPDAKSGYTQTVFASLLLIHNPQLLE